MCQMFSEVTCVTAARTASTYCASIARAGAVAGAGAWRGGEQVSLKRVELSSGARLVSADQTCRQWILSIVQMSCLILHTITLRNNRQCKYFYRLLSSYLALSAFRLSRGYGSEFLLPYCININIEYEIRPDPQVFIFQKFTRILNISCFQRKYYSDIYPKYF